MVGIKLDCLAPNILLLHYTDYLNYMSDFLLGEIMSIDLPNITYYDTNLIRGLRSFYPSSTLDPKLNPWKLTCILATESNKKYTQKF